MCLIPTFFCDRCGHAFNSPVTYSHKGWRMRGGDEDDDSRCPKCLNPDFELLKPEDNEDMSHQRHSYNAREVSYS